MEIPWKYLPSALQVRAVSAVTSTSATGQLGVNIQATQAKYFDLLARYYVLKRQHILAAHVLLRLAERRSTSPGDIPTLEQRLVFYDCIIFDIYILRSNAALFSLIIKQYKPIIMWTSTLG